MPLIWKTVLPGSATCLDAKDFISKIFTILFGNGNFGWLKYVSKHQKDFFCVFVCLIFQNGAEDGNGILGTQKPESFLVLTEHLFCVWHYAECFLCIFSKTKSGFRNTEIWA